MKRLFYLYTDKYMLLLHRIVPSAFHGGKTNKICRYEEIEVWHICKIIKWFINCIKIDTESRLNHCYKYIICLDTYMRDINGIGGMIHFT